MQQTVRIVAGIVLAGLVVFYTWFAFRDDGRLMTVPGVPHAVWFYFDHHADVRNACAFFLLGIVAAICVGGLRWQWQIVAAALSLFAPLAKEVAQGLMTETRHANMNFGLSGAVIVMLGWIVSKVLLFGIGRIGARGLPQFHS